MNPTLAKQFSPERIVRTGEELSVAIALQRYYPVNYVRQHITDELCESLIEWYAADEDPDFEGDEIESVLGQDFDIALKKHNLKRIRDLCQYGIDDKVDDDYLELAIEANSREAVKVLLAAGANISEISQEDLRDLGLTKEDYRMTAKERLSSKRRVESLVPEDRDDYLETAGPRTLPDIEEPITEPATEPYTTPDSDPDAVPEPPPRTDDPDDPWRPRHIPGTRPKANWHDASEASGEPSGYVR